MKSLVVLAGLLFLGVLPAQAFEIELPPHYRENLERKRQKEASILWQELDRNSVESAIREFVAKNSNYGGFELGDAAGLLPWQRKGRVITCGDWHVFLADWELPYPSLARIDWKKARLIVARSYDWRTKVLRDNGDAEVRLAFSLARSGPIFSRKIMSRFDSSDFGEIVIVFPFGGVELRKAKQSVADQRP